MFSIPIGCLCYIITLVNNTGLTLDSAHSFDERNSQISRISSHLLLQGNQLIHIPLRPHEPPVEELRLGAGKPNAKVAWQFLWKIASSAPI